MDNKVFRDWPSEMLHRVSKTLWVADHMDHLTPFEIHNDENKRNLEFPVVCFRFDRIVSKLYGSCLSLLMCLGSRQLQESEPALWDALSTKPLSHNAAQDFSWPHPVSDRSFLRFPRRISSVKA